MANQEVAGLALIRKASFAILAWLVIAALSLPLTVAAPDADTTFPRADSLRVGWPPGSPLLGFRGLSLTVPAPSISYGTLVYSALYRYDERFDPVPDLADSPCFVPGADANVLRCRIVDTTFHDGTPLTADDVAYSHLLGRAMAEANGQQSTLLDVRVVDPRTIDFILTQVDPTFLTTVLPTIPILSRREVEAAYASFRAHTRELTADLLQGRIDVIGEERSADPPDCAGALQEADSLLAKLGAHLYRDDYRTPAGSFDPCAYVDEASGLLEAARDALDADGLVSVAAAVLAFPAAYGSLEGTGPYRLVSETADRVRLEAFAGYHGGPAASRFLDFIPGVGDATDVASQRLDIFQGVRPPDALRVASLAGDLRLAPAPWTGYVELRFNVRPGQLFSDVDLRRALLLCVDLPRDVDAATSGVGVPMTGPVPPGTWASAAGLEVPPRDVDAGRQLIEGAGWSVGADGVYTKGSTRLAASILARGDDPERVQMADLVAQQAADCGMDLEGTPTKGQDLVAMFQAYPHEMPGTTTPFDLVLIKWTTSGPDPANALSGYVSWEVTNDDRPYGLNLGGFIDPAFDDLVEAGGATYDQAERADFYRDAQEELVSQLPSIFLWALTGNDVVSSAVRGIDGPLDLDVPNWAWRPERLVVEHPG